jgi:hypothetical protein
MNIIKCTTCRKLKSLECFSLFHNKRNKSCIECRTKNNEWYASDINYRKTRQKNYYLKNKDKVAVYRYKRRLHKVYSLSENDYKKMLELQNNQCAICEVLFTTVKACVDHCHTTGKIRGLLCRVCNLKLQPLEDKEYRKKAEAYLKSKK